MSDRSDDALRERMELARKATQGKWWCKKYENTIYAEGKKSYIARLDGRFKNCDADSKFISSNCPDVVRADLEEILELRERLVRLTLQEAWLIWNLADGREHFCPMHDEYKCEWRSIDLCRATVKVRSKCWRKAAEKATREITGISGNFLENEEEKKSDGQENGN